MEQRLAVETLIDDVTDLSIRPCNLKHDCVDKRNVEIRVKIVLRERLVPSVIDPNALAAQDRPEELKLENMRADAPEIDFPIIGPGSTLTFTILATDADGDPLTYSAANLPAGATFDAATRTFSWTPTVAQAGTTSTVVFK